MVGEAPGWGWGRGRRREALGAGGCGEVQGGLGSGETEKVVKSCRRCQGRVSPPELSGAGSRPLQVVF